jgi:sulfatase modifying factor 1
VTLALSPIGNAGNAADSSTGLGAVSYNFSIGTVDITVSQYATFLNSVATIADPFGLYNSSLGTFSNGYGITQGGSAGSFSYFVVGTSGNDPIVDVSWLDAARFANWLNNGEKTTGSETAATTEQGAYTLNGDVTTGTESRNVGALYWIPNINEFYKAAYYNPTLNGGLGGYTLYATNSDTAPGNLVGSGSDQANYNNGVYSVTQSSTQDPNTNYLTAVGSFTKSASFYGTFDQNGDVFDWTESLYSGQFRGFEGGAWDSPGSNDLKSSSATTYFDSGSDNTNVDVGFRIATSVPEPGSVALILAAGSVFLLRRKRR